MSREQKLEEALGRLLACPAIADGNHSEPAWGCKETAEAETFARAALSAPKAEAEPVAYLVHNFMVARQPAGAQAKFPMPDRYLYPASRKDDAEATAKTLRADCDPLYTSPVPAITDEAVERECASEGCNNGASVHFVRGDVGSWYCHSCYTKVQALAAFPSKGDGE